VIGASAILVMLFWLQGMSPVMADALFAEKRYAEAVESYWVLLREHPDDPGIWVLGVSLMSLGRPPGGAPPRAAGGWFCGMP
jgi:hypothetical protein